MFVLLLHNGVAQYYITGEVKDEKNQPLQNVKIYMPSSQSLYSSGVSGGFGIPSSNLFDSLIFSKDGYISQSIKIKTTEYQQIVLKMITSSSGGYDQKMVSITTGTEGNVLPLAYFQDESYSNLAENDFVKTDKEHNTEFSMRIDKASYSNIRRFLHQKTIVPPDAVRVDEMLNYFNFNYQEPEDDHTFRIESQVTDCPWNSGHRLLFLNLSAKKLNLDKVPPSNLVFLIDVSGSMDLPNRLPLLKESFQLLIKNLRSEDTVSIVTYGGSVQIWLQPTGGGDKEKISQAIERLTAAGDTPGEAAIRTAYQLARNTFIKDGNNRIILATDGDFNVGQRTEKDLEELISAEKQTGVSLTCLGVGMGNYKDSKIEVLAKKGNGNFAYIDDIREAQKVLIREFTQTLYSVASNVYINIKLDPKYIDEYRLIGYANKKSVMANKNIELEGGEIGSSTGNTVILELVPGNDFLDNRNVEIAAVSLHYHLPEDTLEHVMNYEVLQNHQSFHEINKDLQFAAAVTMFGLKLRNSKYFPQDIDWSTIKKIALNSVTSGKYIETEFLELIDNAKNIYKENSKRKRRREF